MSQTAETTPTQETLITEAVAELIALGAAVAANAENAFQVHHFRCTKQGLAKEDMIRAVNIALSVKGRPHQAIIEMAQSYLVGKEGGCCGGDCDCSEEGCSDEGCGEGGCGCR